MARPCCPLGPDAVPAAGLGADADELGTIVARVGGSSLSGGPVGGFSPDRDAGADGPEAGDADDDDPAVDGSGAAAVRPRPAVFNPIPGVDVGGDVVGVDVASGEVVPGVEPAGGELVAAPLSLDPGRAYADDAVAAAPAPGVPLGLSAELPVAGPLGDV